MFHKDAEWWFEKDGKEQSHDVAKYENRQNMRENTTEILYKRLSTRAN